MIIIASLSMLAQPHSQTMCAIVETYLTEFIISQHALVPLLSHPASMEHNEPARIESRRRHCRI